MKKQHFALLIFGALVFGLLYIVLDTKPKNQKLEEKSRALQMEATGIQNLLIEAKAGLSEEQRAVLDQLVEEVRSGEGDLGREMEAYKRLSGAWYEMGRGDIAGFYAEEVALRDSSAQAWAIAGTTYSLAVQSSDEEKIRVWASKRSRQAFENAISIDPDNVDHKINLALTYVDNPSGGAPMKGILMLRDMIDKNPDEVKVINQLARLALRTNQNAKAVSRLEHAITVEPNNKTTICLLAQAYQATQDKEKADLYSALCTS